MVPEIHGMESGTTSTPGRTTTKYGRYFLYKKVDASFYTGVVGGNYKASEEASENTNILRFFFEPKSEDYTASQKGAFVFTTTDASKVSAQTISTGEENPSVYVDVKNADASVSTYHALPFVIHNGKLIWSSLLTYEIDSDIFSRELDPDSISQ